MSSMDKLTVKLARLATFFTCACNYLYPMLRSAKMFELRRPNPATNSLCASAYPQDKSPNLATSGPLSRPRPNTSDAHHEQRAEITSESIERKSNLPNCDKLLRSWYIVLTIVDAIAGLKYIVLCLLDTELLHRDRYGHLDCLLVGRLAINPRVVGLTKYACLCVYAFHVLYNSFMLGRASPYRIQCLEFLSMNPSAKSYHARPNRSPHVWRKLAKIMSLWVGAVVALYLIAMPLFSTTVLPMIVTRPGFEATYHVCTKWIAKQNRSSSLWWRQQMIDVPREYTYNERLQNKFYLTFHEQWVEFSAYHRVRVLLDTIESWFFLTQIYLALSTCIAPTLIITADVRYYVHQINAAIRSIIVDYQVDTTKWLSSELGHQHLTHSNRVNIHNDFSWPRNANVTHNFVLFVRSPSSSPTERRSRANQPAHARRRCPHKERIAQVQAMVVDLFGLIHDYNDYVFHYVSFCTSVWYTYSFICSSWLFMPSGRQESATIESYSIQTSVTILFLLVVAAYSHTGHACCNLYKTISSVASLQDMDLAGRMRWIVIMKYYKPVPLHCFSMFRTSELSWMWVIKLSAWLMSTLLIVTSFSMSYGSYLQSKGDN